MPTKKASRKSKPPELKVVFDTNVLWTGSASDLLQLEVAELIRNNAGHTDLTLTWYLPEIVRHERQFQMRKKAVELLSPILKLERLLGHNLNITEEIVEQRVNAVIEQQILELGISIISLDETKVDWKAMMLDSAYRRPPFDSGEKEKGFRDALVAVAFLQLIEQSPVTPKVCRIALVTNDELLRAAVNAKTVGATNVRILENLEELKGLINTLVSNVTEEFVQKVMPKASTYFFEAGRDDALFYKEAIKKRINEEFAEVLKAVPQNASTRENDRWLISVPRFLEKKGQRIFWASRITVSAKAYKYETAVQRPDMLTPNVGVESASALDPSILVLCKVRCCRNSLASCTLQAWQENHNSSIYLLTNCAL
jgi:hypothetical protein